MGRKDVIITIRLDRKKYALLRKKTKGTTLSSFLRKLINNVL